MTRIEIAHTWNGLPIAQAEQLTLEVELSAEFLQLHIEAPWHRDPAPARAVGPCEGLWNHEVAELFLVGETRYLELELGPFGHHLALELDGPRHRVRSDVPLAVQCERRGERWVARAQLPRGELPSGLHAWNAFAIHGIGPARRYLAHQPLPGSRPDFHQPERFAPLPETLRTAVR